MPTLFAKKLQSLKNAPDKELSRRAAMRHMLDELNGQLRKESKQSHPPTLRWFMLAETLGVSLHTVHNWARHGRVPLQAGLSMQARFGPSRVKADELDVPAPHA